MGHRSLKQVAQIAIVVPPGAYLSSVGAHADMAAIARSYVRRQYGAIDVLPPADRFDVATVTLLGLHGVPPKDAGGMPVATSGVAAGEATYDIVVIADHAREAAGLVADRRALDWLRDQHRAGALVAGSGAGVALLAAAGLLDGRLATGPWWLAEVLKRDHPHVRFDFSRSVTEDAGLFCALGLAADQALAIRLIERVTSPNTARWLERRLRAEGAPETNTAIAAVPGAAGDPLLERAQYWLAEHFSRPVHIEELAVAMQVSRRTLLRHFTAKAGTTPHAYLRMLRIEAAKRMLERSPFSIDRIAGLVGYADADSFRAAFQSLNGRSPRQWRAEKRNAPTG
jgi:transcriptional regulator GlxA family with amidase domain